MSLMGFIQCTGRYFVIFEDCGIPTKIFYLSTGLSFGSKCTTRTCVLLVLVNLEVKQRLDPHFIIHHLHGLSVGNFHHSVNAAYLLIIKS